MNAPPMINKGPPPLPMPIPNATGAPPILPLPAVSPPLLPALGPPTITAAPPMIPKRPSAPQASTQLTVQALVDAARLLGHHPTFQAYFMVTGDRFWLSYYVWLDRRWIDLRERLGITRDKTLGEEYAGELLQTCVDWVNSQSPKIEEPMSAVQQMKLDKMKKDWQ